MPASGPTTAAAIQAWFCVDGRTLESELDSVTVLDRAFKSAGILLAKKSNQM